MQEITAILNDTDWQDTSPPSLVMLGEQLEAVEGKVKDAGLNLPAEFPGFAALSEKATFEEISPDEFMHNAKACMEALNANEGKWDQAFIDASFATFAKTAEKKSAAADSGDADWAPFEIELGTADDVENIQFFLKEATDHLENINDEIPGLKQKGDDLALLNKLFRSFHTIKGAAGFYKLEHLVCITHELENVLNKARQGSLLVDDEVVSLLYRGEQWMQERIGEAESLLEDVVPPAVINLEYGNHEPIYYGAKAVLTRRDIEMEMSKSEESEVDKKEAMIRISEKYLDQFLAEVGDLINLAHVFKHASGLLEKSHLPKKNIHEFKNNFITLEDKTENLQSQLMKLRKVKLDNIFKKVPKIVDQLSSIVSKDVRVNIDGADVEIDKSLLEVLSDPLVHILRNSLDHGIETPQEREEKGKDPVGTLTISATEETQHIKIDIQDDGKGIDSDIIATKALEKKIVTEEHLARMSQQQKLELIFLPGFSTAQQVSEISGRGVGMDVVRSKIMEVNGQVKLISELGKGSTLSMILPKTATLATRMIFRVRAGDVWYGIPMSDVEYLSVTSTPLPKTNELEVFPYRDAHLPIINLRKVIDANAEKSSSDQDRFFVVVNTQKDKFALEADELGEFEVHVLQDLLAGHFDDTVFEGAGIMGDGSILLFLEMSAFVKLCKLMNLQDSVEEEEVAQEKSTRKYLNTLIVQPNEQSFKLSLNMDWVVRIESFVPEKLTQYKQGQIYQTSIGLLTYYEFSDYGIVPKLETSIGNILILDLGKKKIAVGVHEIVDMYSGELEFMGSLDLIGVENSWSYNNELVAMVSKSHLARYDERQALPEPKELPKLTSGVT